MTIATWTRVLPWQPVATLFGCAWGTVERAVEAAVVYGLAHRDVTGVTHIGIDEISRKKGHVYVTNVYDLTRKRLLWSGEGRTRATLEAFFDFLGADRIAALEGVCCDMWQPYINVVKARAPWAVLVFDKFHIVSHLMTAVDQVALKILPDAFAADPDRLARFAGEAQSLASLDRCADRKPRPDRIDVAGMLMPWSIY